MPWPAPATRATCTSGCEMARRSAWRVGKAEPFSSSAASTNTGTETGEVVSVGASVERSAAPSSTPGSICSSASARAAGTSSLRPSADVRERSGPKGAAASWAAAASASMPWGPPTRDGVEEDPEHGDRAVELVFGGLAHVQRRVLEEGGGQELGVPLGDPPGDDAAQRVADEHGRSPHGLAQHADDVLAVAVDV